VSDEQQPLDGLSKRERQKARRQQKIEAERAAARSERTKKTLATGLVAVVVLGALGVWGVSAWTDRQARQERIELARANLDQLGCTEVEEQAILPSPHLGGNDLATSPPDVIYPDRPTTSGPHLSNVAQSGAFDKVVDERLLVHNLEHGYINIFVHEDVPDEEWQEVAGFVDEQISGLTEKVIATRWKADMPGEARFVLTAWGARQACEQWDRGIAEAFIDEWHYLEGNAPERTLQPHLGGTRGGGIDPNEEDGDLLFPPLGDPADAELGDDVMEEPEGNVEEGEDGPREDAEPAEPTEPADDAAAQDS
jgi:hypothetical protein